MKNNEFSWVSTDDIKIYGKEWSVDNPKAVICMVHGLGEHINRYDHVANYFRNKNIAFVGYDRRGHGQSGGPKGRTSSYEAFLDEVTELLQYANEHYPQKPIFLYGHSMGGNITLCHLIKKQPNVVGVIVTGSLIRLPKDPPKLQLLAGKWINKIGGFVQGNGLDVNHISKDKNEVKKYNEDPLVHDRLGSRTGIQMLEVANWLANYNGGIKTPTLVMHGGEDQITSPMGSKQFTTNNDGDITYKEWNGMYHEIHNESAQKEVFDYTYDWMNKYL